jgi:hypothetical protein
VTAAGKSQDVRFRRKRRTASRPVCRGITIREIQGYHDPGADPVRALCLQFDRPLAHRWRRLFVAAGDRRPVALHHLVGDAAPKHRPALVHEASEESVSLVVGDTLPVVDAPSRVTLMLKVNIPMAARLLRVEGGDGLSLVDEYFVAANAAGKPQATAPRRCESGARSTRTSPAVSVHGRRLVLGSRIKSLINTK